jgi:hypothetical protein
MCSIGFEILTAVAMKIIFWDITPCSALKFSRRFEVMCLLALLATRVMVVSLMAYSTALKTEATVSSEALVDFQRPTWSYMPQDNTLRNVSCFHATLYCNEFDQRVAKQQLCKHGQRATMEDVSQWTNVIARC